MSNEKSQLETLAEIRALMENSSRFLSLSGLSGIFAGIFALLGAAAAYFYMDISILSRNYFQYAYSYDGLNCDFFTFFFLDAAVVLTLALMVGVLLTMKNARKKGLNVINKASKMLIVHLFIPLAAGGLFCLILVYHGYVELVAPATLIFYGLALLNGGKYTFNDIRYLGAIEILIGLTASIFVGYGLLFWALGFGVMHIVYGLVMYNKYEKVARR